MAQLSLSELITRGVPLSTGEAVTLTLAVAAALDAAPGARPAVPRDDEIFLNSTGEVTFTSFSGAASDETTRLAALLHRLLRLDERGSGDRRGRAPGALLVVLARTLRQIDLPPLGAEAFHDALARFTGDADPAVLAAVFWRAARMRPRGRVGGRSVPTRGIVEPGRHPSERRLLGPSRSELRRALRQTERELFTMRRLRALRPSRRSGLAALVVAALVIGLFSMGGVNRGVPARSEATNVALGSTAQRTILVDTTPPEAAQPKLTTRPARPKAAVRKSVARAVASPAPHPEAEVGRVNRVRSVYLVNLPRSPWTVVR